MRPRVVLFIWSAVSGIGATIIALPDSDRRILAFSGQHGPSLADSIGALLLITASGLLTSTIVQRWAAVAAGLRRSTSRLGGLSFLGGLGLGLLIAGVFTDFWWWWLVGAGLIQVLQFLLWGMALKGASSPIGSAASDSAPTHRV